MFKDNSLFTTLLFFVIVYNSINNFTSFFWFTCLVVYVVIGVTSKNLNLQK